MEILISVIFPQCVVLSFFLSSNILVWDWTTNCGSWAESLIPVQILHVYLGCFASVLHMHDLETRERWEWIYFGDSLSGSFVSRIPLDLFGTYDLLTPLIWFVTPQRLNFSARAPGRLQLKLRKKTTKMGLTWYCSLSSLLQESVHSLPGCVCFCSLSNTAQFLFLSFPKVTIFHSQYLMSVYQNYTNNHLCRAKYSILIMFPICAFWKFSWNCK